MITAEEFVLEINDTEQSKNFKLATVIDLFENDTAKVQFDGEDTASEKQYAYLESYTPEVFDRVLLAVTGGTYVILGKVNYNISPPTVEELDRYLFDQKIVTMTKGLSVVGNIGINGDITGINLSASGQLKGGSISTTGTLTAGDGGTLTGSFIFKNAASFEQGLSLPSTYWGLIPNIQATNITFPAGGNGVVNNKVSFNGVTSMGDSTINNLVTGNFRHNGTSIGFFNKGLALRPSASNSYNTLSTSATLVETINKLNTYINLLKDYGLAP